MLPDAVIVSDMGAECYNQDENVGKNGVFVRLTSMILKGRGYCNEDAIESSTEQNERLDAE